MSKTKTFPANSQRFYVGNQPEPDDRTQIVVSAKDAARIPVHDKTQKPVRVHDFITGKDVTIRSAACGLSCFCALEFCDTPQTDACCPECHCTELLVYTTLCVAVHTDASWDVETPFAFDAEDDTHCTECDWEGPYEDAKEASREFHNQL